MPRQAGFFLGHEKLLNDVGREENFEMKKSQTRSVCLRPNELAEIKTKKTLGGKFEGIAPMLLRLHLVTFLNAHFLCDQYTASYLK